jgi:hypothetical protein
MVLLLAVLAHAIEPGEVQERLAAFNAGARYPLPTLQPADVKRLVEGKLVKLREQPKKQGLPQRLIGLRIVDHPKEKLFLAASDPHSEVNDDFTERWLEPRDGWPRVWYQYLDLSWPFTDRHWVVDVSDNHALAAATGNMAWEHWWALSKGGLARARVDVAAGKVGGIDLGSFDAAVKLPVNTGAWLYISLPDDRTLFGFHVQTVVGGNVPDKLVVEYAYMTLDKVVSGTAERAPEAAAHYDAAHAASAPVPGGDGKPLPAHGR